MQSEEKPAVQLAYLLPLAELLICWTLLFLATPGLPRQISVSLHPPTATRESEKKRLLASEGSTRDWRVSVTQMAWLANAPGMWSELATSTQAWPDSWFPFGFPDLFAWRAVLWPLAAMPFWLSAGRGLDWFFYRSRGVSRVGWLAVLLAFVNVVYGALLVSLGLVDDNPELRSLTLDRALSFSGGLWVILGAITCCAGFLQWRASRELLRPKTQAAVRA